MNGLNINYCNLGLIDYKDAFLLQHKLLKLRQDEKIEDILLLLEHNPVLTMGTRAKKDNILMSEQFLKNMGIEVFETERGGDVTYHGNGQIVGYPILDLKNYGKDIHLFVENIEEIFIRFLKDEYNILASRNKEYTGVWVLNDKITAIGIAVKRWVSMHGFAFNVNTNLEHFKLINPCGILEKGVTSLEKLLGEKIDMDFAYKKVLYYFCEVFNVKYNEISKDTLFEMVKEN